MVPTLSHANVARLVGRYLKDNPPALDVRMDPRESVPYNDAFVRAGILRVNGQSWPDCDGVFPAYAITPFGLRIIDEKHWHVDRLQDPPSYMEIPLGSVALVHGSIALKKRDTSDVVVRFTYFFHGNANVPYLLSLAPPKTWGDVGVDGGGDVVSIGQAGGVVADKLMLSNEGDGWYVNDNPYPVPIEHCDSGVPQTPAPQPAQTPV